MPISQEPSFKLSPKQVGLNKDEILSQGNDILFPPSTTFLPRWVKDRENAVFPLGQSRERRIERALERAGVASTHRQCRKS